MLDLQTDRPEVNANVAFAAGRPADPDQPHVPVGFEMDVPAFYRE
jgi:hypothetical protein